MNYIEKVFKQYPFIYFIGGRYYAFGTGVCSECDTDSILLEKRYIDFEDSIGQDLTTEDAWGIFHKLIVEAEYMKDKNEICVYPEKELLKFHFGENEMNELNEQVERYIDYWKKYKFDKYLH